MDADKALQTQKVIVFRVRGTKEKELIKFTKGQFNLLKQKNLRVPVELFSR